MIVAYYIEQAKIQKQTINAENIKLLKDAIWLDLVLPTEQEEALIEKYLGFDVPTKMEMHAIEISSRLYKDNGTLFMTATMLAQSDTPDPKLEPVTFVLTQKQLITIRYIEPTSFKLCVSHLEKSDF